MAGRGVVESICDHPLIRAVSFVGSTPVARAVYERATRAGKRVQALGGAKNFVVVMPDADLDHAIATITESFYGCAGERCLAGSVLVPVGAVHAEARERLVESARRLRVGDGMDPATQMGPVISGRHRERVVGYIERGISEGAHLVLDGRSAATPKAGDGFFLGPSVFDSVDPAMTIARDEIFGPVASVCPVADLAGALDAMRAHPNANAASIFTSSGKAARGSRTAPLPRGWRQRRSGGSHGLLSLRRRERQLLRGPEGPRPGRVRVLHRRESRHFPLVLTGVPRPSRAGRGRTSVKVARDLLLSMAIFKEEVQHGTHSSDHPGPRAARRDSGGRTAAGAMVGRIPGIVVVIVVIPRCRRAGCDRPHSTQATEPRGRPRTTDERTEKKALVDPGWRSSRTGSARKRGSGPRQDDPVSPARRKRVSGNVTSPGRRRRVR
jgi:hypothetical protein